MVAFRETDFSNQWLPLVFIGIYYSSRVTDFIHFTRKSNRVQKLNAAIRSTLSKRFAFALYQPHLV